MKLFRSAATVSAMTLLSRLFGFARDLVLARVFGVSGATDAFFVAFRIPNLLRRWFGEGAFALAFVPVLSRWREHHPEDLRGLIDAVVSLLFAIVFIVVAVGILIAPLLIGLFAPGFVGDDQRFDLAVDLLRIMFPYALLISMTALAGAILNAFERFALPALSPILLNLALICGALLAAPQFEEPIRALAWAVLIAGVAQWLLLLPALYRLGLLPRPRFDVAHRGVKRIVRLMVPTLVGSSAAQINILVDTLIASLIATGSVTWLYYADRLLEFPLGVFGIALGTVVLPTLSRAFARTDGKRFAATLNWGITVAMAIALPAAVGLAVLAEPMMLALFAYGAFDPVDARFAGLALTAYAIGLPGYVLVKVVAPGFYAREDAKTPVKASLAAIAANFALNIAFVVTLVQTAWLPAHVGLALASALAAYLNAALLARWLRAAGALVFSAWATIGIQGLASLTMGALLLLALPYFEFANVGAAQRISNLTILVMGGGVVYAALLILMGLRPWQWLKSP